MIAAGLGSFQPKKLAVEGADALEGRQLHYRVRDAARFHGQRLVIFGGGDSALDWVIDFCGKAASLVHVHRRAEFRAAPASVARMRELVAAGRMEYVEGTAAGLRVERRPARAGRRSSAATARSPRSTPTTCSRSSACIRSSARSPSGGSSSTRRRSGSTRRSSRPACPGIFAIGDINTYPGKKKLILSGFHEAALAAFAIAEHLNPAKKVHLQYTTTSPIMQKRLGRLGLSAARDERPARRPAAPARARAHRDQPVPRREPRHRQPAGVRRAGARPGAGRGQRHGGGARRAFAARVFPAARRLQCADRLRGRSQPRRRRVSRSRRVVAIQHGQQIFHMSASFQTPEAGLDHQLPAPAGAAARDRCPIT